jgi:hypothetical protein
MSAQLKYDWRFENSINWTKEQIPIDSEYSSWRTNGILSNFVDTIIHANQMNLVQVTPQQHFDYMLNAVPKKKRFQKKKQKTESNSDEELIAQISERYKYSKQKTKEFLSLLSKEQLDIIKK